MLFNSFDFFIFFPVVTILYFLVPHAWRWILLLGASCYFYMSFIPIYILILALTILVDYTAAIKIEESQGKVRRFYLVGSIIVTCVILFVFKYFNFFNSNVATLASFLHWNYPIKYLKIILPIGLSFHTFQSLSYVIEVYRGNQKPERHFGIYALYVMFYPQLVAGPIERPQNLLHQFHEKHSFDYDNARTGLMMMLWGLFKKVVIADRLSVYVSTVYSNPSHFHGWPLLVGAFFFAFQIYCDFSGYSDIAIGAARVMGFKLMTNFNYPYISTSINEFWHRWHISLSTWFRDYLYIPLGGSRVTRWRWYYNLLITFIVSGLWHGAAWTFIIWGSLHGSGVVLENVFKKERNKISARVPKQIYNFLCLILVFCFTTFSWIFFRANNIENAFQFIKNIFRYSSLSTIKLPNINQSEIVVSFLSIFFLLLMEYFARHKHSTIDQYYLNRPAFYRWSVYVSLIFFIAVFGNFGNVEFIYFQF